VIAAKVASKVKPFVYYPTSVSCERTAEPPSPQVQSPAAEERHIQSDEGREPTPVRQAPDREGCPSAGCLAGGEATDVFSWAAKATDLEPDSSRLQRVVLDEAQHKAQVSFDVWSTIIHRRCHPDEIKLRSARFLLLNAWEDVRPELRSPVSLMTARMHAENASAPHGDYEYRFADAIAGWLREALVPLCTETRRGELSTLLVEHEMAAESDSIELDDNIARTIRSLKKAPIFISDFYMESSFLERLLENAGLKGHFVRGYASCDIFKNKRTGELFRHVLDDFKIAASDLIHIGDNPISDLERPTSLGIKAVPYVSSTDEERNDWYAIAFNQLCGGDLVAHHRRMLALADTTAATATPGADDGDGQAVALFGAGCRIGLLAFGYCLNIMQDAIIRKAREVVFFAREGILFKQIYDVIAAQNPFDTPPPPSRLLFVSRRATFAASLRSYDNEEFMRLWSMYSRQSPSAFANSLNLDPLKASAAARRVGISPDEAVSAPWSNADFQAFLTDPAFKRYAVKELARQRDLLHRYLRQEINFDQDELLIVDIGWRGTIQDNIAHAWDKPVRGHYLALFRYLNQQVDGSSKVAWLSDANLEGDYRLPDQVTPIEMVFNGLGGSTIGYEQVDGRVEPVRQIFAAEEATVNALTPCQAGMMAVVPKLARYVKLHGLMAGDLLDLNRKVASDLLASPPAAIADIFGRLEHNETFGVGAVEAMDELGFGDLVLTPPGPELHDKLKLWLGTRWPDGMSRQSVVATWWRSASPEVLASAPLAISRAHFPAIVRATGSRLAVYVSEPVEGSGGYRNVMSTVKALIDVGFNAEIYVEAAEGKAVVLDQHLGSMGATVVSGWAAQRTPTLALATGARSAGYVAKAVRAQRKGYLVQDVESAFHPLSEDSIEAENSYSYGLHHFTIGNWLSHLIRAKYGALAYPAGFGVDTSIYKIAEDVRRKDAICILYQPHKLRRASSRALRAAEIVKRIRPQTTIYVYGSHHSPKLDCEHHNLGFINDLAQLNALYNRCRAGVCLSMSNPSRIPFEMAAAGCRPVDLFRYNNLMDHIDGVSTLAFQSPESIAAAILSALDDQDDTATVLAGRMRYRSLEWERDAIVANVLSVLDNRPDQGWTLRSSFNGDPVLAATDDMPAVREYCLRQRATAMTTSGIIGRQTRSIRPEKQRLAV
jgi:O-antigen biosynthesis protein